MKISGRKYLFKKGKFKIMPDNKAQKPEFFYKYYSVQSYNLEAFIKSQLYFSHPLILNDLFDASIQLINLEKISLSQLVALYDNYRNIVWKENPPEYYKIKEFVEREYKADKVDFCKLSLTFYWNIIFKKVGLLSLASHGDNILLWSYYNNNEGFALEFSELPVDNIEIFGPFPINYKDKFEIIFPKSPDLSNEELLYVTNIKSKEWKHEGEWRLLLRREDLSIPNYPPSKGFDKRRLVDYSSSIVNSVILGFKYFKEFVPEVIDKRTYKYTVTEDNDANLVQLKVKLLNHLIDNQIPIKQIQTKDDNTFCIESAFVNIEILERDKVYVLEKREDKMTPNMRSIYVPGISK